MPRIAVALAVLTVTAVACADPPRAGGGDAIDHPDGTEEIVLRLSYEGGFVPIEYNLTQVPAFSLYGDGRIVVPGPQIAIYPGPALPAVNQRRVSEDGVQAILRAAIDAGLGKGDLDYTDVASMMIADASTAVFTLSAGGTTSRVSVYALGDLPERLDGMTDEEFEARRDLSRLVERLTSLDRWLPEGSLTAEEPFDADGYRVFVARYRSVDDLQQQPADWPLASPLVPGGDDTAGFACMAVEGDRWTELQPLAREANQLTPWTSDGDRFSVLFRPLLPDESGC